MMQGVRSHFYYNIILGVSVYYFHGMVKCSLFYCYTALLFIQRENVLYSLIYFLNSTYFQFENVMWCRLFWAVELTHFLSPPFQIRIVDFLFYFFFWISKKSFLDEVYWKFLKTNCRSYTSRYYILFENVKRKYQLNVLL